MFVKIDREHWVNMLLVETVFRDGGVMNVVLNGGQAFTVAESHEADVFKAMRDLEVVLIHLRYI